MQKLVPITHTFAHSSSRPVDSVAFRFKRDREWMQMTWRDYNNLSELLAGGLVELGIRKADCVAVFSNTRMEWSAIDMAILGVGAITVPVYQSHSGEELSYTLQHSGCRVLVVENAAMFKRWLEVNAETPQIDAVIVVDGPVPTHNKPEKVKILDWDQLLKIGASRARSHPREFQQLCTQVRLEDVATIVYTSGTSGRPKGALITHMQIASEVNDLIRTLPISPMDSTLTFLPFAHVLGRVEHWLHVGLGFTMCFAESLERLQSNLRDIQPTVIIGVPRIFEKIYANLLVQIEGHPLRKSLFNWIQSHSHILAQIAGERLIFKQLRDRLGGRLRFVVSGGAPLEPQLGRFFKRVGITILEGYGLTETTAAITINTPFENHVGTVGRPLPSVEIKIAEDGEILVKAPQVMREYYKDSDSTDRVIRDGYFATGDIGEFDSNGFLKITDRKKDLIKTSGGKYVAPQKIEGLLKMSPLISNVVVHGDRRKYIVALLTIDQDQTTRMAKELGWPEDSLRNLTKSRELKQLLQDHIKATNSQLASFETIKNFAVLDRDLTVESGELTPSLKVKRKVCDERYKDVIDSLY